jgi:hypothetical protein
MRAVRRNGKHIRRTLCGDNSAYSPHGSRQFQTGQRAFKTDGLLGQIDGRALVGANAAAFWRGRDEGRPEISTLRLRRGSNIGLIARLIDLNALRQIPPLFAWRSEAREEFEVKDRALARPSEAATALAVVL